MKQIYLDYNATTPIAASVLEAMLPFLTRHHGNPSSQHAYGQAAFQAVEEARRQVAQLLAAEPEEIVFTSGGSESSNLAIKGLLLQSTRPLSESHVIISAIEHPATTEPVRFLHEAGCQVSVCGCNAEGVVSAAEIESLFRPQTVLVSLIHAHNETGCIQPVAEMAQACRARGILSHADASQSVGKIPTNVDSLGVDLMTIAGHKFYAPKGIGALFVRRGLDLEPLIHGGGQERGLRAGTENVPYIVGLGKAAQLSAKHGAKDRERTRHLRDRLLQLLLAEIDDLTVNGLAAERLPNTLSLNFPGVAGYELLARAPEVSASTGSACHSGSSAVSATLAAMGVREQVARGTIRLSLGWPTSTEEVEQAAALLVEAWRALQ